MSHYEEPKRCFYTGMMQLFPIKVVYVIETAQTWLFFAFFVTYPRSKYQLHAEVSAAGARSRTGEEGAGEFSPRGSLAAPS